jgi:hypothetical protein
VNCHLQTNPAVRGGRALAIPEACGAPSLTLGERELPLSLETAWKEAHDGGCNGGLWMLLAEKREKDHPEDALPIYQREVESTLSHAKNDAYAQAVKLLKKVGQVMTRMGDGRKFAAYLESVRVTHARKRNFVRLLSRANWTQAAT